MIAISTLHHMILRFNDLSYQILRLLVIVLSSMFSADLVLAQEAVNADTLNLVAILEFDQDEYQLGDLVEGEKVERTFTFKNTGTGPLVLQNVISTCGCTVPEWPKEPVEARSEGKIKVVFNSKGKIGWQNKLITVRSNARAGDVQLFITALVLPKKKG